MSWIHTWDFWIRSSFCITVTPWTTQPPVGCQPLVQLKSSHKTFDLLKTELPIAYCWLEALPITRRLADNIKSQLTQILYVTCIPIIKHTREKKILRKWYGRENIFTVLCVYLLKETVFRQPGQALRPGCRDGTFSSLVVSAQQQLLPSRTRGDNGSLQVQYGCPICLEVCYQPMAISNCGHMGAC